MKTPPSSSFFFYQVFYFTFQGMEVKRLPLLMVSLTFLLIALKVLRALALKLGGSDCWICGAMIVLA